MVNEHVVEVLAKNSQEQVIILISAHAFVEASDGLEGGTAYESSGRLDNRPLS